MFEKFPSIGGFHLIRRDLPKNPNYDETKTVDYKGKVKLHGTNAGVCITPAGEVRAQKRTSLIGDGHFGFANWVKENEEYFKQFADSLYDENMYIFGEWAGPGIQKNVALSQIPHKVFAVFSVQFGPSDELLSLVVINPLDITDILHENHSRPDNMHVLPWHDEVSVCYVNHNSLQTAVDHMNEVVADIEAEDPWVKENFGISGVGEGIVYYPVSEMNADGSMHRGVFSALMFKAKGEKHQVNKQKSAVIIEPEKVKSANEFVAKFVTDNRLEQALQEACDGKLEHKMIGPFIGWVSKDVKKESVAELEASDMEWKFVNKYVSNSARIWYLDKLTEI